MNETIISVENATKTYLTGSVTTHALRGVDLSIARGSFTGIIGPSGHGKSTLMHLIGGLDHPSSGTVTVAGMELSRLDNSSLAEQGRRKSVLFSSFSTCCRPLRHKKTWKQP